MTETETAQLSELLVELLAKLGDGCSMTVQQFCQAECISKDRLYEDWANGKGPAFYLVGRSRRISQEARREWRRAREREAAADPVATWARGLRDPDLPSLNP